MLELPPQECKALEKAALGKIVKLDPNATGSAKLAEVIAQTAVRATIETIREYERMKGNP